MMEGEGVGGKRKGGREGGSSSLHIPLESVEGISESAYPLFVTHLVV